MDLWIRSQNKEVLVKANCLQIKDKTILNHSGTNFKETLGEYKTKQRALEILDKIQNWLSNINRKRNNGMAKDNTNEAYNETYQMPEE